MSYLNYLMTAYGLTLLGMAVTTLWVRSQLQQAKRWAQQQREED